MIFSIIVLYIIGGIAWVPLFAFKSMVNDNTSGKMPGKYSFKRELSYILNRQLADEEEFCFYSGMVFWPIGCLFVLVELFHFLVTRRIIKKLRKWCEEE